MPCSKDVTSDCWSRSIWSKFIWSRSIWSIDPFLKIEINRLIKYCDRDRNEIEMALINFDHELKRHLRFLNRLFTRFQCPSVPTLLCWKQTSQLLSKRFPRLWKSNYQETWNVHVIFQISLPLLILIIKHMSILKKSRDIVP